MVTNSGSKWPTSGVAMAFKTRGLTSLGPGPMRILLLVLREEYWVFDGVAAYSAIVSLSILKVS
jgi:hypothetical protein